MNSNNEITCKYCGKPIGISSYCTDGNADGTQGYRHANLGDCIMALREKIDFPVIVNLAMKRYSFIDLAKGASMKEDGRGKYVLYSDCATADARNTALRDAIDDLLKIIPEYLGVPFNQHRVIQSAAYLRSVIRGEHKCASTSTDQPRKDS